MELHSYFGNESLCGISLRLMMLCYLMV